MNSDFSRIETDAQEAVEDNRGERQKEPPRRGSFGTFLAFLMALVAAGWAAAMANFKSKPRRGARLNLTDCGTTRWPGRPGI